MEKYQHCHQYLSVQELNKYLGICNLQIPSKRTHFFHIVKYIVTNVRYWYSSASPVICFIGVVYDIVYQILNILSQIYYLTIAKVPVSLP